MVKTPVKHLGLYVHSPFCISKCRYCDFASWDNSFRYKDIYIKKLLYEIESRRDEANCPADSVFFGGGTPSLLLIEDIEKILLKLDKTFAISKNAEITLEANPGTVDLSFLKSLKALGINRISFGVQAAQGRLLKTLGRKHSFSEAKSAIEQAYSAGIKNINADLMFGIPAQTIEDFAESVNSVSDLPISHISCYGLIVEDGTPIKEDIEKGLLHLPDAEYERQMYYKARELLHSKGIEQYEISNFAFAGMECRHNIGTWRRENYLGFGVSAASLINPALRRSNTDSLMDYLKGKEPVFTQLSLKEQMFEYAMLGFRMTDGIDKQDFFNRFNMEFMQIYGERLMPSIKKGLVEETKHHIRLTKSGMDIMNSILLDIMD
jgi:oxygen-independent coproporphyrinogen-3 oxidase